MSTVKIISNAVIAQIIDPTPELDARLQNLLSYKVAGAEQSMAFQSGSWDGRSSFYEMRKHRFPAGFTPAVRKALTAEGHQVLLKSAPLPEPLGEAQPLFDEYGYTNEAYKFQLDTTATLLRHGRMIAQVATGGGKSRIAQIATARVMRPTLFLTTRSVLMYQMRDHFTNMLGGLTKHYGSEYKKHTVGVLGDGEWNPRQWINVGMVQTLASRLKMPNPFDAPEKRQEQLERIKQTRSLLERFEFVILEEAHETSGDNYYDILKLCKNAHYRLALTATPFMKEDEEANMNLMAASGPIGIRVTEKQLIDSGILATPYFRFLELPTKPSHLMRSTPWQAAYRLGIVENPVRNTLIVQQALEGVKHGLPVLILVQQQKHGKILEKTFKDNGIRSKFIFGETNVPVRRAGLEALANGKLQVLIGSNILDVGVDVPALGMVILAAGGKAEVQLRQRIGRGLRAKKSGPNVAYVVDFNDRHNKHLAKHSAMRRKIIEDTPGFGENILQAHEFFDYSIFGSP